MSRLAQSDYNKYNLIIWFYLCSYFAFRKEAAVEVDGHFLTRQVYDDMLSYDLVGAAVKVLSKYVKSLKTNWSYMEICII